MARLKKDSKIVEKKRGRSSSQVKPLKIKPLIVIGNDHAGVLFKRQIVSYLEKKKYFVKDLGSNDESSSDDYVDYAKNVCQDVLHLKHKRNQVVYGILLCGSGSGMCIAANKISGIRAAVCTDTYMAKFARLDNDANVLCLRSRHFSFAQNKKIIDMWFKTKFSEEVRHIRRIKKLQLLDLSKISKRSKVKI
jgi:RpiB/LacA/LacB family sugar-phosphate isomerase